MTLYLLLLLGSIIVPIALSFDKKLQFYKQWKYLMPSIIVVAVIYIAVDIYFTRLGIWGFNAHYHSSNIWFGLPMEEWLFFIVIPYASIFLHDSIVLYFTKFRLKTTLANYISFFLIIISLAIVLFNLNKTYTVYIFSLVIIVLALSYFDKTKITNSFYLTFLAILIPFILVNAVLTGSFIDEPVVWYNNSANLGIRFLTIPVEDFFYAFSLILFSLLLRERVKKIY